MIPLNITREHIIQAINEMKKGKIPFHRESTRWSILYDGEHFPPKYAISLANKFAGGRELGPNEFSGGHEANNFLKERGFEIIEKDSLQKLALIGAVNNADREQNYEDALLKEIVEHKHTWTGWTFPLQGDKRAILEDYVSKGGKFNLYFYMSKRGGGSGLVEYRLQIDDFKYNAAGMVNPEPDVCYKGDVNFSFKGYFRVKSIEKLVPPLPLEAFLLWEDPSKNARPLQSAFEYVNDVFEIDNLLPSREQVEQAISLIGKRTIDKVELFNKIEELLGERRHRLRSDWLEVTWSKICEEWAEKTMG